MTEDAVVKCKLLVRNREVLKNEFHWESTNMIPLCAYLFSQQQTKVDAVRMKECKRLIKRNAGIFTKVKGDDIYPLASMLTLENNVDKALDKGIGIYQELCKQYKPSLWLTMVAFILAEQSCQLDQTIARAIELEQEAQGTIQVGDKERGIFLVLALSSKTEEQLLKEFDVIYQLLAESKLEEDAKKLLTVVLVLGDGTPESKVHNLEETNLKLKEHQLKIGNGIETAALGLAATSENEIPVLIEQAVEVNEYLKGKKGFDSLQLSTHERLMYAIMLPTEKNTNVLGQKLVLGAMLCSVIKLAALD